ncbi:ATP synthase subunit B family protein [Micromonospora chersina]|uniref:ATPase n=1 Tax=Micromonospora chersina TaxID=47854 RepID=UPI00371E2E80
MRFSVVQTGYDQRQVDSCLDELGIRLVRLAARAESAAGAGREWDQIREDATHLCDFLRRRTAVVEGEVSAGTAAEREAAALVAQARSELEAAREEARQVREQAYAEAVRARRDFEAALLARRRREARVDEVLAGVRGDLVSPDTPTAAAGLPTGGAGGRSAA